uniref:Uncharacterized protein n=1 Tax=Cyanoderma ruficeps TaxID=181631 RepID=A0A8C3R1I3_9PASS
QEEKATWTLRAAGGLVPSLAPHGHPGAPAGLSGRRHCPHRLLTTFRPLTPPVPAFVPCPKKRLLPLPGQGARGGQTFSRARCVHGSARANLHRNLGCAGMEQEGTLISPRCTECSVLKLGASHAASHTKSLGYICIFHGS